MLAKRVVIEVMHPSNKRVLKRYNIVAPPRTHWNEGGIQQILDNFVQQFDDANPNHHYRLVELPHNRFRLVHGEGDINQ